MLKSILMRNLIQSEIEKVVKKLYCKKVDFDVSIQEKFGDYSSNVAMILAKVLKSNPMVIANNLKFQISRPTSPVDGVAGGRANLKSGFFEKIDVAHPGFLNFYLSEKGLMEGLANTYSSSYLLKIGRGKKVQVEFISANPTGPLTVGNARGGPFGDVLANVLQKAGYQVKKTYYINDYGMQILTLGHSVLKDEKAQYKGDYIDYLNKKIKGKDPYQVGERAAKVIIDEMIRKTIKRMGIKFDEWFWESSLHKRNVVDKTIEILKKKKLIYKKEGAVWFKSSKFGDERDRVLVKKDGWKTYLAGDIAYHRYKFEKQNFDKVINIWGADHAGDVAGLQAGMNALGHKGKLDIILLQFVTLLEKREKLKMSKRLGTFVTMDELLNKIPLDAVRFFFLQKSVDTHLNFDLELAKEQSEKNPVYYTQYACARMHSILAKSQFPISNFQIISKLQISKPIRNLILKLIQLPEVVEDIANDYQVQRLTAYAYELASEFSQFYRDVKVIGSKNEKELIALVALTRQILADTLKLLGISFPEKM
jgi:arginyl-tRNA synthetase